MLKELGTDFSFEHRNLDKAESESSSNGVDDVDGKVRNGRKDNTSVLQTVRTNKARNRRKTRHRLDEDVGRTTSNKFRLSSVRRLVLRLLTYSFQRKFRPLVSGLVTCLFGSIIWRYTLLKDRFFFSYIFDLEMLLLDRAPGHLADDTLGSALSGSMVETGRTFNTAHMGESDEAKPLSPLPIVDVFLFGLFRFCTTTMLIAADVPGDFLYPNIVTAVAMGSVFRKFCTAKESVVLDDDAVLLLVPLFVAIASVSGLVRSPVFAGLALHEMVLRSGIHRGDFLFPALLSSFVGYFVNVCLQEWTLFDLLMSSVPSFAALGISSQKVNMASDSLLAVSPLPMLQADLIPTDTTNQSQFVATDSN